MKYRLCGIRRARTGKENKYIRITASRVLLIGLSHYFHPGSLVQKLNASVQLLQNKFEIMKAMRKGLIQNIPAIDKDTCKVILGEGVRN